MRIDTVLLKVASRCNLNCSYCYVYNMGDDTWRRMPKRMSLSVQAEVARQLGRLARSQASPFAVVLHGGEPLLLGSSKLETFAELLKKSLPTTCSLNIQTNGILIDDAVLEVCDRFDIGLSISLDGPSAVHDKYRVNLRGNPSHSAVLVGLDRLRSHPQAKRLFSGLLAVVDPSSDPVEVYEYLKQTGTQSIDFLVRDGNLSKLPWGKRSINSTEYGEWLCRVLDHYLADQTPPRVRLFDDLIKLTLGVCGSKEGLGITDFGILVIDTDGSISKNDTLKSTTVGDRFRPDWNINCADLCEIIWSDDYKRYHDLQRPTSSICNSCSKLSICGGGMLTHRFDGDGYDNPTVYCADQRLVIDRVVQFLSQHLPGRVAA